MAQHISNISSYNFGKRKSLKCPLNEGFLLFRIMNSSLIIAIPYVDISLVRIFLLGK